MNTYYALRDYGTATWDGGDAECDHVERCKEDASKSNGLGKIAGYRDHLPADNAAFKALGKQYRAVCGKCGATRIDRQIGLEPTIAEYLDAMVAVFREVRRVLRDDGTLWLNIGDSYAGSGKGRMGDGTCEATGKQATNVGATEGLLFKQDIPAGLKPKDLMMIPARLALALQDDGWWVRSEIIWAKPNPMPESVQDRPTTAHEHIWLLTKQARYYYDADAIRRPHLPASLTRYQQAPSSYATEHADVHVGGRRPANGVDHNPMGANARTVWDIATSGFAEAHFATFPLEIPRRCILAGTSERGACAACGAPWRRVVEREFVQTGEPTRRYDAGVTNRWDGSGTTRSTTLDWQPTCRCDAGEPVPCVVLDPFSGSGTTGVVALRYGRDYIGIELNESYVRMSERRIRGDAPLLNQVTVEGRAA